MIPGFVRVSVTGEQCERFLNLCRGRDMELRKIIRTGEKEFHVTPRRARLLRRGWQNACPAP